MSRLIVNPNRPDSWDIPLKEGTNHLGRGDAMDFKIADGSVSSTHCTVMVANGDVSIQDLGSTNGTFLNGQPVQIAKLHSGQIVRLGNVEMMFSSDASPPSAVPAPPPATPPPPAATSAPRLRVTLSHAPAAVTAPVAETPPPLLPPIFDLSAAAKFCKFHPKNYARWFCGKCKKSFCDLCVNAHHIGGADKKLCRTCAVECAPLEVEIAAPSEVGFMSRLPGAFIYPFRGTGVLILIVSTILFSALGFISGGIFALLAKMAAIGYLFSYMQNIIHATANEEAQLPELPGMDDVFGGFFRLAGTVVMSFGLPIGMLVARFFEVEIPVSAIIVTVLLGCIYFPMAFLAVAIKDNVLASNPLIILPSIIRVPGQYLVTVILFASIFGIQQIGKMVSGVAGSVSFTTTSMAVMFGSFAIQMVWSFISVYLLTVNMRILGLLYATQKEKLAWF